MARMEERGMGGWRGAANRTNSRLGRLARFCWRLARGSNNDSIPGNAEKT